MHEAIIQMAETITLLNRMLGEQQAEIEDLKAQKEELEKRLIEQAVEEVEPEPIAKATGSIDCSAARPRNYHNYSQYYQHESPEEQ